MARRELIGEAYVKFSAETGEFVRDLAKARAEAEAALKGLDGRKRVEIIVDAKTAAAQAKMAALAAEIESVSASMDDPRVKEWPYKLKRAQAELERLTSEYKAVEQAHGDFVDGLDEEARKVDKVRAARKRLNDVVDADLGAKAAEQKKVIHDRMRTMDQLHALETKREEQRAAAAEREASDLKKMEQLLASTSIWKRQALRDDVAAAGGASAYIEKLREERKVRMELNELRRMQGLAPLPLPGQNKKNTGIWALLTNSGDWRQTLSKIMREPVKLGPFTATVKGLTVGFTMLGPVVASLAGGVTALASAVGGALVGAMSVGTAAVMGFGQAFLGVGMVLSPYMNELKMATQATDAHTKAVYKYGANSKQAKKAQQQLNNVLSEMSPTARRAFKDFSAAQTEFATRTRATKPMLDKALGETMKTFRALSPNFAKNTVGAVGTLTSSLSQGMGWLRKEEKGGGGFLNTTFKNANAALGPLLGGLGRLAAALGNIGASASRHLKPLTEGFNRLMQGFLGKTSDKNALNGVIDSLMLDFKSVGGAIGSATKLLINFFNAGRGSGRDLFDGLTSTFERWNDWVTSKEGAKKLNDFFDEAKKGFVDIIRILGGFVRGFVLMTKVLSPAASIIGRIISGALDIADKVMSWKPIVPVIQGVATALIGLLVVNKLAKGFRALRSGVLGGLRALRLIGPAAAAAEGGMTAAAAASTTLAGRMKLLLLRAAPVAAPLLAIAAAAMAAYGGYKLLLGIIKRVKEIQKNPSELDPRRDNGFKPAPVKLTPKQRADQRNITNPLNPNRSFLGTPLKQGFGGTQLGQKNMDPFQSQMNQDISRNISAAQSQLTKKGGAKFATQVSMKVVANTDAAIDQLRVLQAAAKSKLSKPEILKILANAKNADDAINRLLGIRIPNKDFTISARDAVSGVLSGIRTNFNSLAGLLGRGLPPVRSAGAEGGAFASGGIHAAASGYTKQTAYGNAKRRAPRRAMGAFREPTFLVGEENRTEYVIATNPAYRSQNQRYLAAAAADIGMEVVPAARGYSPRVESLAYFGGKATAKEIKRSKERLKRLRRQERDYKNAKVPKKGRSRVSIDRHNDRVREIRELTAFVRSGTNRRIVREGDILQALDTRASTYDTLIELATREGKGALAKAYRDRQASTLRTLIKKQTLALRGTRGRANREQLAGSIASLRLKLFENQNPDSSALDQAESAKKDALITSLQNSDAINSAFVAAAGSMLGGSFSSSGVFSSNGGVVASGGSRMSRKGAAGSSDSPTIVINTLHPGDPDTLTAIGEAATGGLSLQGAVTTPRITVG